MSGNSGDELEGALSAEKAPDSVAENDANGAKAANDSDGKNATNGSDHPSEDEKKKTDSPVRSDGRPVRKAFCGAVSKLHSDDDVDYSMEDTRSTRRSRRQVPQPVSYNFDAPKIITVNLARSNAGAKLNELLTKCNVTVEDISKSKDRKTAKRYSKALNSYKYSQVVKKLYREEQTFDALELFGLSSKVTPVSPEIIPLPSPTLPSNVHGFVGLQPKPMASLLSEPSSINLPAGTTSVPIVLPSQPILPNQPAIPGARIQLLPPAQAPVVMPQIAAPQPARHQPKRIEPAVMQKVNKLVTQSVGAEVKLKSVDLIEVCQELHEAQKTIRELKGEIAFGVNGTSTDNIMEMNRSKEDAFKMLTDIPEPKLDKNLPFQSVEGYRLVDMQLLSLSLEAAQRCGHGAQGSAVL